MKNKKATYPNRMWLGKYSSWLLTMGMRPSYVIADRTLSRLFDMFPKCTGIEQFTSVEIADYIAARRSAGTTENGLLLQLWSLHKFWKWLIEDKGLYINNPIRFRKHKSSGLKDIDVPLQESPEK